MINLIVDNFIFVKGLCVKWNLLGLNKKNSLIVVNKLLITSEKQVLKDISGQHESEYNK